MNFKKICVSSILLSLIFTSIAGSYSFSLWVSDRAQAELVEQKQDLRDDIRELREKTDKIYDLLLEMNT